MHRQEQTKQKQNSFDRVAVEGSGREAIKHSRNIVFHPHIQKDQIVVLSLYSNKVIKRPEV